MSIFYSVDVTVNAPHNQIIVTRILQRGVDLRFTYYARINGLSPSVLTSDEATFFLLEILNATEKDPCDAYLTVVCNDTNFLMRIDPIDNNTHISIFSFGQPWQRPIDRDSYTIDFARYIKVALELCRDFSILELTTTRDL